MKRLGVFVALLVISLPVLAYEPGGIDDVYKTVEASMVITGEIAVNPDGSVYGYSLDQRGKLPADIVKLIGNTLPQWKFTPVKVAGKAVRANARMSLRVVARQSKSKHWVATVAGAQFGDDVATSTNACQPGACVAYVNRDPPAYPLSLVRDGVAGTVYLKVDVNRQGRVVHAAVSQIDLHKLSIASELKRWRDEFASATLKAARNWTFRVPTTGRAAKSDHWVVEVPVTFDLRSGGQEIAGPAGYGQWNDYVPGPVHSIPWATSGDGSASAARSADAIPNDGKLFVPDARFVLLNHLGSHVTSAQSTGGSGQG